MHNKQAPSMRGERAATEIKREHRERDKDESWKSDELEAAEEADKAARRDGASDEEKRSGLSVPRGNEEE